MGYSDRKKNTDFRERLPGKMFMDRVGGAFFGGLLFCDICSLGRSLSELPNYNAAAAFENHRWSYQVPGSNIFLLLICISVQILS